MQSIVSKTFRFDCLLCPECLSSFGVAWLSYYYMYPYAWAMVVSNEVPTFVSRNYCRRRDQILDKRSLLFLSFPAHQMRPLWSQACLLIGHTSHDALLDRTHTSQQSKASIIRKPGQRPAISLIPPCIFSRPASGRPHSVSLHEMIPTDKMTTKDWPTDWSWLIQKLDSLVLDQNGEVSSWTRNIIAGTIMRRSSQRKTMSQKHSKRCDDISWYTARQPI